MSRVCAVNLLYSALVSLSISYMVPFSKDNKAMDDFIGTLRSEGGNVHELTCIQKLAA